MNGSKCRFDSIGAGNDDETDCGPCEHGRKLRQPLGVAIGVNVFDQKVLTFDPSKFPHPAAESVNVRMW
jgi:hypothetical protein